MSAYYHLSRERQAEARAAARRAALAEGVDWRINGDDDRFIGKNWLSDAAFSGDLAAVVEAFSGGYDWDINDRTSGEQGTVLLNAIRGCHRHTRCVEVVEWLLAHGADPNAGSDGHCRTCPLHICGRAGDRAGDFLRIATMLIEAGADVNARRGVFSDERARSRLLGRPNAGGHTVLHCAAQNGAASYIRLLLKWGADINARMGVNHSSALEMAATPWAPRDSRSEYESRYSECRTLLEDVTRAGSWKSYVLSPRKELLALRVLCEHGRARTSHPILGRLFPWSPPPSDERAPKRRLRAVDGGPVPKEIFWHIVGYWRSRDKIMMFI